MTREEAIKQLKDNRVLCIDSETEPFAIAYDLAIKALEQEPRWIAMVRREPTDEEKAEYLAQNGDCDDDCSQCPHSLAEIRCGDTAESEGT